MFRSSSGAGRRRPLARAVMALLAGLGLFLGFVSAAPLVARADDGDSSDGSYKFVVTSNTSLSATDIGWQYTDIINGTATLVTGDPNGLVIDPARTAIYQFRITNFYAMSNIGTAPLAAMIGDTVVPLSTTMPITPAPVPGATDATGQPINASIRYQTQAIGINISIPAIPHATQDIVITLFFPPTTPADDPFDYTASVSSIDDSLGTVSAARLMGNIWWLQAIPVARADEHSNVFSRWDDGNTSASRIETLTADTSFQAVFYTTTTWQFSVVTAVGAFSSGVGLNLRDNMATACQTPASAAAPSTTCQVRPDRAYLLTGSMDNRYLMAGYTAIGWAVNGVLLPNSQVPKPSTNGTTGQAATVPLGADENIQASVSNYVNTNYSQNSYTLYANNQQSGAPGQTSIPTTAVGLPLAVADFELLAVTNAAGSFTATVVPNDTTMGTTTATLVEGTTNVWQLTATPADGYEFVGWSDGWQHPNHAVVLGADTIFTAIFQEKVVSKVLAVVTDPADPVALGAVGVSATPAGDDTYDLSYGVVSDYKFVNWSCQDATGEVLNTTADKPRLTISDDTTCTAHFVRAVVTLTGPNVGVAAVDDTWGASLSPESLAGVTYPGLGGVGYFVNGSANAMAVVNGTQQPRASDQVAAYDDATLWFSLSHEVAFTQSVTAQVYAGDIASGTPIGSAAWVGLPASGSDPKSGIVYVPVASLPPGSNVTVVLTVDGTAPVVKTYNLGQAPTDNGFNNERATALADVMAAYDAVMATNPNIYGSKYIMAVQALKKAAGAVAAATSAADIQAAGVLWAQYVTDAGNGIFHDGIEVMVGTGTLVTLPAGATAAMAIAASLEQRYPGVWTMNVGYGGGTLLNMQTSGGQGTVIDNGRLLAGTYVVFTKKCMDASTGPGSGMGLISNACPFTVGIASQGFDATGGGSYSSFGAPDNLVRFSWAIPGTTAGDWPTTYYAWPGTMGWSLGELREAYGDDYLNAHGSAFPNAIADQNPFGSNYEALFDALRLEYLDFLYRDSLGHTEATRDVIKAIDQAAMAADIAAARAGFNALTPTEQADVFNYKDLLAAENPNGVPTGSFTLTAQVSGEATGLIPGGAAVNVNYTYPPSSTFVGDSGTVHLPLDGSTVTMTDIPADAKVTFSLGALPSAPGLAWATPTLSVNPLTVVENQTANLTIGLTATFKGVSGSGDQKAAAAWLGRQLAANNDVLPNDTQTGTDWGKTEDAVLALAAAKIGGDQIAATADKIWHSGDAYIGAPGAISWSAVAKTILTLQVAGLNPAQFPNGSGTRDLVSELLNLMDTTTGQLGGTNDANGAFQYALAVFALARTSGGVPPQLATWLQGLQCTDSTSPALGSYGWSAGCTSPDIDYTAMAVQALVVAGVAPSDPSITNTVTWMLAQQDATSGGFNSSMIGLSSNSTGLAVQSLTVAGETSANAKAVGFVSGLQITCQAITANPGTLELDDLGAIALNDDGWDDRMQYGLDAANSDQWQRATAQALFAFGAPSFVDITAAGAQAALPAPDCSTPGTSETPGTPEPPVIPITPPTVNGLDITVHVIDGYLYVTGTGFQPGEQVTGVVHSEELTLGTVTANNDGKAVFPGLLLPDGFEIETHTVILTGSVSGTISGAFAWDGQSVSAAPDGATPPVTIPSGGGIAGTGVPAAIWAMLLLMAGTGVISYRKQRQPVTN